jgi:hypothetical protein
MKFDYRTRLALKHPAAFALRTLRAFRANQGLLLAGAVAYYALLSIVPLLILTVIALSRLIDEDALLSTLGRYLEWLVPGQSAAVVAELAVFLQHRDVLGLVRNRRATQGGRVAGPCCTPRRTARHSGGRSDRPCAPHLAIAADGSPGESPRHARTAPVPLLPMPRGARGR